MYLRFLSTLLALACVAFAQELKELRVCADPENPPFSTRQTEGFENKVAKLIGRELGVPVKFVWSRMGRGFVRNLLDRKECDLLAAIPSDFRPALATQPYYRSSYVIVTRRDRKLNIKSLDDPRLPKMKIGVQVLDEDYAPPAQALARRGSITNLVGFETTGDSADSITNAVLSRKVDVALVWGPLAGFYARRNRQLTITPVQPQADGPFLPLTFAISVGVRKSDVQLRDRVNAILNRRRQEIDDILKSYGVPLMPLVEQKAGD